MDDVVAKTGISFLVTVLAAAAVWALPGQAAWGLALPAVLVAFVLGLVITFKQIANPAATLAYGALYGVALGAIRVTPKLTRWVLAAGIGVLVLMLANIVASWIGGGDGLGLRTGGPLAIGFSLLVIGVAAF